MGITAGAFAFTPARFAVFAEGPTDLILLPTLLREATNRRALDFQVAPGLALVSRQTASTLELEAARVQYVVDSDRAGREIMRVLRRGGVDADDILELKDGGEDGLTLEDFIDAEAYRLAVNEELRRSHGAGHELARTDIPAKGRAAAVRAWCERRKIAEPKKVNVARHIVEMRGQHRLVAPARRRALQHAYSHLRRRLRIDELDVL
jgi:predicted ATP-dependent endonuclease of OLD family